MQQRGIIQILASIRQQLERRGSKQIRALGRTFRALDSFDGNSKIDPSEFLASLRQNGISDLSRSDLQVLFSYFDRDNDGLISFNQFLVGVRGQPNARRQSLIDKAFLKFDRDGNGYVDAADLRGVYDCSFHPRIQKRQITEDQALMEFLQNFNDRNRDGRITKAEWDEYYAAVSNSIDDDDHFVLLVKTAWRLD